MRFLIRLFCFVFIVSQVFCVSVMVSREYVNWLRQNVRYIRALRVGEFFFPFSPGGFGHFRVQVG